MVIFVTAKHHMHYIFVYLYSCLLVHVDSGQLTKFKNSRFLSIVITFIFYLFIIICIIIMFL